MYHGALLAALVLLLILACPGTLRLLGRSGPVFSSPYLIHPDRLLAQHRLLPGTRVLLAGSDSLLFALRAARLIAPGSLTCVGDEPQRLNTIREAARDDGIGNVVTLTGDLNTLPLPSNSFDQVVVLVGVLGRIDDREAALAEMARVLKERGRLTISDSIFAPGYQPTRNVVRWGNRAGLAVHRKINNVFSYTLEMTKPLRAKDSHPVRTGRPARSPQSGMAAWPGNLRG